MSLELHDGKLLLVGECERELAQPLLDWVRANPDGVVDLSKAGGLHGAVVQVLRLARVAASPPPSDRFLKRFVLPALLRPPAEGLDRSTRECAG